MSTLNLRNKLFAYFFVLSSMSIQLTVVSLSQGVRKTKQQARKISGTDSKPFRIVLLAHGDFGPTSTENPFGSGLIQFADETLVHTSKGEKEIDARTTSRDGD